MPGILSPTPKGGVPRYRHFTFLHLSKAILISTKQGIRLVFLHHNPLSSTWIPKSCGHCQHVTVSQNLTYSAEWSIGLHWPFFLISQKSPQNHTAILISCLNRTIFLLLYAEAIFEKLTLLFSWWIFSEGGYFNPNRRFWKHMSLLQEPHENIANPYGSM